MSKGRIDRQERGGALDDNVPAWLDSSEGDAAILRQAAAAGRDWSFGWIWLGDVANRRGMERGVAGFGRVVEGGSGRVIRARLPADRAHLQAIRALASVAGLGAVPTDAKLSGFKDWGASPVGEETPVYVSLMADDRDGQWRRAMQAMGAVVGGYDQDLRVYRANADVAVIEALAKADFVLSVEPIPVVQAAHDTAVPAMGADVLRSHDGAPGIFVGTDGASVPIAVMDTGLNVNHPDIAMHRDSICGANFAYTPRSGAPNGPIIEEDDLWVDADGHGTHVTGTVAGNGFAEQRFAGMAPGVRHIRFAKVLNSSGSGSGDGIRLGMNYLARASDCRTETGSTESVKPLIVNMSLSASARHFEGRDSGARKLDAVVWRHRQLYVVAQSNSDIHGFSNYGAAKNALAVGAATDGGALAAFSSHGPTADGRLAPNVVGAGVGLNSAAGGGSRWGYEKFSGTSMASPAVAGVAALLMDAAPAHRERPALTRARLMASAIRPDPWLAEDAGFPLHNSSGPGPWQARYGMGKVSARTTVLNRNLPEGWHSGSATSDLADGEYAWHDIEVPPGASRLDLVMTWDEPPADAISSTVLNDLDLWLDRDADCAAVACGEHASRSRIDNVEWIIVRNPEPGRYRAKVQARRVYTQAPRAALAWTVIRGNSTPTLAVEASRSRIAGAGEHELTLEVSADSYVAAGARLHIDCRAVGETPCHDLLTIKGATVLREDGIPVDLEDDISIPVPRGHSSSAFNPDPISLGAQIPIGEIAVGERLKVMLRVALAAAPIDDAAHLHLTATAWNARAGSTSVAIGAAETAAIARPGNDAFKTATPIEGAQGSVSLDLLHASPEPGEPVWDSRSGRPASSLWYVWTAPADGLFRFRVPTLDPGFGSRGDVARYERIGIYRGEQVAALRELAAGPWTATVRAERGRKYYVRVGGYARGAELALSWSPGERPANDDLRDAVVLEGESGVIGGSSAGATLESGESLGTLAATTWYRWTAPRDGNWQFEAGGLRVLAFEGDAIESLRLVSAGSSDALFPVGAEKEYFIAVAENDAAGHGGDYSLRWEPSGPRPRNDSFALAEAIDGGVSEQEVHSSIEGTVQPGEPAATGVQTLWWAWRAPSSGLYTWRLGDLGEPRPSYPKLRLTLFTGQRLADLELAAEIGPGAPFDTLLDVAAGEVYWIAVGLNAEDEAAYVRSWYRAQGKLIWGPTPVNDEPSGAVALNGAVGSLTGSTTFATAGSGERSEQVGRQTLWWDYEADESGWVQFALDDASDARVLTVYRESADGLGGREVLTSSRFQRSRDGGAQVVFEAEAGVRYAISLGIAEGGGGGAFELRWRPTAAPTWLHYVGHLADGDRDSRGSPVAIGAPAGLAIDADGQALHLASSSGLHVFSRDPASGRLDPVQQIESDFDFSAATLLWDSRRNRLYANNCGAWRWYAQVDGGPALEALGERSQASTTGTCAIQLIMSPDGSSVYRLTPAGVEQFAIDGAAPRLVAQETLTSGAKGAVLSNDGSRLFVATRSALVPYEVDPASGALTRQNHEPIQNYSEGRVHLAITEDDAHLFVGERDTSTALLALTGPSSPQRLSTLEEFWDRDYHWSNVCRLAAARPDAVVVDVLCPGLAFTAAWDPKSRELVGTDWLGEGDTDRFNGLVVPGFGDPVELVASPDGEHLYLATAKQGILVFSRSAGAAIGETASAPEIAMRRVWSSTAHPTAGATFRLSALVRNGGTGPSVTATVRFLQSRDRSISAADSEVGSVPVGVLPAAGTRSLALDVAAPAAPGNYYYGACVEGDDVVGGGDDCSEPIEVTVNERQPGAPDLVVDLPTVDVQAIEPGDAFTLGVVVRNQGDADATPTKLRYYRSDNGTVSAADEEVGDDAVAALASGAEVQKSLSLTAPAVGGTHFFGACVQRVGGEVRTRNNCSEAVPVEVSGGGAPQTGSDDHGDAFAQASIVAVPSTTTGNLEQSGDQDFFRFDLSQPSTLTVETNGGTDTYGSLFDGNQNLLENDDDGGTSLNFRISRPVAAGTYYLSVSGYDVSTGAYSLSVQAAAR
ncbi:MAG: DVUA0089 family protein [Gammaproteobacteria bacterium]|nr:DVUA0089 family protein [Gammaproteobacteria bacterium]